MINGYLGRANYGNWSHTGSVSRGGVLTPTTGLRASVTEDITDTCCYHMCIPLPFQILYLLGVVHHGSCQILQLYNKQLSGMAHCLVHISGAMQLSVMPQEISVGEKVKMSVLKICHFLKKIFTHYIQVDWLETAQTFQFRTRINHQ